MHFSQKQFLKNVLHVSYFSSNLIYKSKIIASLTCELIFSSIECVIHDFKTKDKIGSIDLVVGLYGFYNIVDHADQSFSPTLNCIVKNVNLWHYIMGHPSDERLKVLKSYSPNICIEKSYVCDTCRQAKQKRHPFFLSDTHTI